MLSGAAGGGISAGPSTARADSAGETSTNFGSAFIVGGADSSTAGIVREFLPFFLIAGALWAVVIILKR